MTFDIADSWLCHLDIRQWQDISNSASGQRSPENRHCAQALRTGTAHKHCAQALRTCSCLSHTFTYEHWIKYSIVYFKLSVGSVPLTSFGGVMISYGCRLYCRRFGDGNNFRNVWSTDDIIPVTSLKSVSILKYSTLILLRKVPGLLCNVPFQGQLT
jgi:hypothetical protein